LLPSENYTDYYLPYFEGYQWSFSNLQLTSGDTYTLKNVTTINQSTTLQQIIQKLKEYF
jgi:hypothetical protein